MRNTPQVRTILALALASLIGAGDAGGGEPASAQEASGEKFWRDGTGERASWNPVPTGFADLAEQVKPAVVSIQARQGDATGGAPDAAEEFVPYPHPFDYRRRDDHIREPTRRQGVLLRSTRRLA